MLLVLDRDDVAAQSSAAHVTEPEVTAVDVGAWLKSLGLEQYEAAFRENAVTAALLPNLTADDLKDLGITLVGHRRQLLDAIAVLRSQAALAEPAAAVSPSPPADPSGPPDASEGMAERRPLSVMFCDLIGSTALSAQLDPEDLREVIRSYQARVAATIQPFNGFIARYVGDGVLIYFGWPEAHETDAARAVRAGLAVAVAVGETPVADQTLQVRIGIATGLVVVGEPIGSGDSRQQTAVGETPNVAARLQGLAGPNQVVIDAATRRQIGRLFDSRDLGTIELKGLPAPVPAWQVISENRTLGQFEALCSGLTPLVGRDEELELLLRRWAQAKAGKGRVVLISAEAGVGKSRLAEALAERIAAEPHIRLRYFCSPHHQNNALYPIIAQVERAAGFAQGDGPDARLAKLQVLMAASEPSAEDVALLADLSPLDLTPQQRREKTFEGLLRQLEGLSRQQPVLMVFDDLHWIDPSTRELLDRVIERVVDWPVLLLGLFRPEFQPPWAGQPQVTMLTLAQFDRHDTAAMVVNVATIVGNTPLPLEIVEEIAERTDGIPLFIEEVTKAVIEAGGHVSAALSEIPHSRQSVPSTLHASLMARLDRLGPAAREVAQAAAVVGRESGYELLASITDLPKTRLQEALDRLTNAGLVFVRGTPPEASYLFKHVLVQDAAYGSLLRDRRRSLHKRIVAALEERFPEVVAAQPALLAQHCQEAGLAEQALGYWLKAGQQALSRSALAEAATQSRKGLEILTTLPDGPWRQQQELDLQFTLRGALATTKGFASTETVETLARAEALAAQVDRPEYVVPLMEDRWRVHMIRAEFQLALSFGNQIEDIGEARNDVTVQARGRRLQGISRYFLGELVAARALLEEHADPAHPAVDPRDTQYLILRLAFLGLTLAVLGYIDQARSRMGDALSLARRIRSAPTLAQVLLFADVLNNITGSPLIHTEEALALSTEQKFPQWLGLALACRGLALAALGQPQEAFTLLTQALAQLYAIGAVLDAPVLLGWLANVAAMLGQTEEAWRYLADAAQIVEATGERVSEAEVLHRVPGDLLNAAGDRSGAEQHYRQAIAVAEQQSAKLLQLRSSTSLARLWCDQGRRAEARDLLVPIYDWFTEGFDTPVLKEAKALLDELA